MISKDIAVNAHIGQVFYHVTIRNKDGSPARARVNGQCKTWVRKPEEFNLPMKHGLKTCFYISTSNMNDWCETEVQTVVEGP